MDVYGASGPPEGFQIDDLLDLSNYELFSTSSTAANQQFPYQGSSSAITASTNHFETPLSHRFSTDLTDDLRVPDDDVAELEWLSNFVDDSFTEFPPNSVTGTINVRSDVTSSSNLSPSKRSRPTSCASAIYESDMVRSANSNSNSNPSNGSSKKREQSSSITSTRERSESPLPPRKCTHCASENTPQWRTGPLGPKTLCNACGVRYKSGRLVPEYRPAASPTFVLTQHSNSHRKVLELRRQKELLVQQQQEQQQQQQQDLYGHYRRQVC